MISVNMPVNVCDENVAMDGNANFKIRLPSGNTDSFFPEMMVKSQMRQNNDQMKFERNDQMAQKRGYR
jgi:hypothetical protein